MNKFLVTLVSRDKHGLELTVNALNEIDAKTMAYALVEASADFCQYGYVVRSVDYQGKTVIK
jgi:hypothetical protein